MREIFLTVALLGWMLVLHSQELPATVITDIRSGKKLPFNEIVAKGRVTLISFWATWCVPGKRQVKTIIRRVPEWRKQAEFDYIAIAVDLQGTEDLARNFALSKRWSFPEYIDAESELKQPLVFQALPFILIIDKKGKIVYRHTGHVDGEELWRKLRKVAGLPNPSVSHHFSDAGRKEIRVTSPSVHE